MISNVHDILRYPHVTEKSTLMKEERDGRVVTFRVDIKAKKQQILEAVESIFEVEVEKVRTAIMRGKIKRQGKNSGQRPNWKKAYVTLKPGQKSIEFFEGV